MIYNLQVYYGALLTSNNKDSVIYSICSEFNDSSILPTQEWFDGLEDLCIVKLVEKIKNDGFNPDDFWYDYITEEQYMNGLKNNNTVEELLCEWKDK